MKRKNKQRGKLTFVCGPPGSGKTTYCQAHAEPLDLIWDLDAIAGAMNPHYELNANRTISMSCMFVEWRDILLKYVQAARITNNLWCIITSAETAQMYSRTYGGKLEVMVDREESHATS
jgi:broad-specificity NMP kinase